MKIRGIFIPMLFCLCTAAAQDAPDSSCSPPRNLIAFSSGLNRGAVRDEMMSPMRYSGTHAPMQLTYLYRGMEFRHVLCISYGAHSMTSAITDSRTAVHTIARTHLELSYTLATRVLDLPGLRTSGFAGIEASGLFDAREHSFQKDRSHSNVDQLAGLGIGLFTESTLKEGSDNMLRCEIGMPILAYTFLRDHYNPNVIATIDNLGDEENAVWELFKRGHVVWLGTFFEIRAAISYLLMLSNQIGFDLQYRFSYYSYSEYEELFHARVFTNQLLIGLTVAL